MREWRKLYGHHLVASERLSLASFEARWLFILLIAKQDDGGQYPWTLPMVRSLVATTDWTMKQASEHLSELERLGLVSKEGAMVVIRRGKELNGVPPYVHDRRPRFYQAPQGSEGRSAVAPQAQRQEESKEQ